MSKSGNPFLVGLFVIGAAVLAVLAVLFFGTGTFLARPPTSIMYFEGNVNGLRVGAPVTLRGVQVGEVTSVKLLAREDDLSFLVPVVVKFDGVSLERLERQKIAPTDFLSALVKKGLRAQLQLQSIVTGLLFVNLDFFPETEARFVDTQREIPEIPTVPSRFEELSRQFDTLPIKETVERLNRALEAVATILSSEDAHQFFGKANTVLDEMRTSLSDLDAILEAVREDAGPTAESLRKAAAAAADAAEKAGTLLDQGQSLIGEDSTFRYQLEDTLQSFDRTLRSTRGLVEYLDRHPEALIFGRERER